MLTEHSAFSNVVEQILRAEGGYVHSPLDPGGETKYGISKRAYPDVDIANLTKVQACEIYYRDYWRPVWGDKLPLPLALLVTDHAVNAGTHAAVVLLQRIVGARQDGIMGSQTAGAAVAWYERHGADMLKWYSRDRIKYYSRLNQWDIWGSGWTHRVQESTILATRWAVALDILKPPTEPRLSAEALARMRLDASK